MATLVLVHGAMHGGWCWNEVAERLRADGHTVTTPTLTGQGERRHLLTRDVGVHTHVQDLVEHLWFEDLRDVVLGLHSYAGVLAGPVVDRSEGRVRSVAYLGAFVARPGECLLDVEPPETADRYRELAASQGSGWRVPASDAFLAQWGVTDPRQQTQVGPRLTDFPLRCCTEPVSYSATSLEAVARCYVRHTDPPLPSLERSYERARLEGPVDDIACGHDLMLDAPDETAELLGRIAQR